MIFSRNLDNSLYSKSAVSAARQAFASYCSVQVTPVGERMAELTLTVKHEFAADARQITLEFWNYMLDSSAQGFFEKDD